MKVLLTGGGTGGHITPLLAVAHKLKSIDPSIEVIYVGEHGSKFKSMTSGQQPFDKQYKVFAGKLRRYNGESWFHRLLDVKTNFLNLRDMVQVVIGTLQSLVLIPRIKPDVILLKGGFVGVPIGLAAALYHTPFVTHDSDAVPGLANRLVGRWARFHATGMPLSNYNYPQSKARYVGVLVGEQYQYVGPKEQKAFKKALHVPEADPLLLITGGSLGARNINQAMVNIADDLLKAHPKLQIVHQVGRGHADCYKGYSNDRLQVHELLKDLHLYTGAADVVVTRAGANTLAELGVQAKPCIVVPNPLLTGGHQTKNAQHLQAEGAALIVEEDTLDSSEGKTLQFAVEELLRSATKRRELGSALHRLTPGDATAKLTKLLLQVGGRAGE